MRNDSRPLTCVLLCPAARFISMKIGLITPFFRSGASPSTDTLWKAVMRSPIFSFSSSSGTCEGKVAPFFCPPATLMSEVSSISSMGTAFKSICDCAAAGCAAAGVVASALSELRSAEIDSAGTAAASRSAPLTSAARIARSESNPSAARAVATAAAVATSSPWASSHCGRSEKTAARARAARSAGTPYPSSSATVRASARRARSESKPSEESAATALSASTSPMPTLSSQPCTDNSLAAAEVVSALLPVATGAQSSASRSCTYRSSTWCASSRVK
mmetsp:Transcript_49577/g.114522  ORF Transcript_49577/g.114522 Transcript_49577/m.114522 type:complete len:276 (+) Transcript_49577:460-1287(+)